MEGFIALAVFAERMSKMQEKVRLTQDLPRSDRHDEGLLSMKNSTLASSCFPVQVEDTRMAMSRLSKD
jgi:hypothetical protein